MKNIQKIVSLLLIGSVLFAFKADRDEEGIFTMSHLTSLDLKKAGLEIPVDEIYNEEKPALVNALVRLGGCTGSFISDQGLIITNHHCVFSAVAGASTAENNHLENGFYAQQNEDEIKTTIPCKITLSYSDVSEEVLKGIDKVENALEKKKFISDRIKSIVENESLKFPDLTIEISEMLVGKQYTLFRYKLLTDVRLVYVPPKNIGKFGGETDNWEWPRHNADFSIVRAYENGKPYDPEAHMEVNPAGTKEGDFTFILGYPGRTYRNQTAEFLTYQNDYILPIISSWYDYRIEAIEAFAGDDVDTKLSYSGRLASLSNVTKNFKGKMQGLRRTNVIEQTFADQEMLKAFAQKSENLKSYVPLFDKNSKLYARKFELSRDYLYLSQLYRTGLFSGASNIAMYQDKLSELNKKEQVSYIDSNQSAVIKRFGTFRSIKNSKSLDKDLFKELFYRLSQTRLTELRKIFDNRMIPIDKESIKRFAGELWEESKLSSVVEASDALDSKPLKFITKNKGDLINFARDINEVFFKTQAEWQTLNAEIDEIIPRFNDIEMEMNGGSFVPDANGTLRFTYGYINGYEPEDAVVLHPFTTLDGVLEKAVGTTNPDYFLQPEFIEKMQQVEPADILKHPRNGEVVVGLLYNMDTTGGNSGSPIMDSKGRLVGVNFDRAYTATINDYAWNESYSRSIGVDIRYVLYVMKYFGQADEVLDEMGVQL